MLDVKEINYESYNAYLLENQYIRVIVLPEVGGRIVSYDVLDHEFLYTIPELKGKKYNLEGILDIESYRRDLDYTPAGGYKTWLAPQSEWEWPPYLDLAIGDYEVEYEVKDDRLDFKLISPQCRETGIRLTREISLFAGQKELVIDQGMKNHSTEIKEFGLWDVTQLKGQGRVVFPIESEEDIAILGQGEDKSEIEIRQVNSDLFAIVNCQGKQEFKVGTSYSAGWILTVVDTAEKKLGYLKEFPVFADASFGHGCAVEVFDTYKYNYFEVEVHGPLIELDSGVETSFVEEWSTYSWDKNINLEEIILSINSDI
jgi:hypothetical protein